ncbi:MAG: alpha-amylase family glycosyl hydrolase [Clostridium sp.]|nr:alpha-amylase family glycosyl hydrolase [Clostridium sp.]
MARNTDLNLRGQVIYSIYVRNHTEEGTFKAVEKDLERIKNLGTDIIWFMPIHPIGIKNKKGDLGCPYAIRNYREVNPEYGTLEDFKSCVNKIHDLGMKCIIDVVYNHTSPDSWLVENHPEYFYKKPDGNLGNRVGEWWDVVDLDYNNKDLWNYQIDTLKMWAEIVDGFRCDVASLIPVDFWIKAREEVSKVRSNAIWLAESVHTNFLIDLRRHGVSGNSDCEVYQAFDICYDYDVQPYFVGYLKGENTLSYYIDRLNLQEGIYPENYIKLRFLENHDNPRAKDLIKDENQLINWTAFQYFQKGTTLIYAGQETENTKCPSLFDKDTVDWNTGKDITSLMKKLYKIKKNDIFIDGSYSLYADEDMQTVIGYYEKGKEKVIGVFSLKGLNGEVKVNLQDGEYINEIDNEKVIIKNGKIKINSTPIILFAK